MAAQLAFLFLLGGTVIRPYVPPVLEPEPPLVESPVKVVQIAPFDNEWDASVLARPSFVAPLVGHVLRGARVGVRGQVEQPKSRFCPSGIFYAIEPFGWLCSNETRATAEPKTVEPVLQVIEGTPLPYRYVMVLVNEGEFLPMWGSVADLRNYVEPERQLARGDTIALGPQTEQFEGNAYYVSVDNKVLPVSGTKLVEKFSEWQGVVLPPDAHFPFGWVTPQKAGVFDAPKGTKVEDLPRRTRLDVLEEQLVGSTRWLRIGDARWIKASDLNEVRKVVRPESTGIHPQWFDVDLGEQVLVAYNQDKPVYATLTSSGRDPNKTPRGNYPVWGKATAITMKSQGYDDLPYYVNKVPWVMFFQAHNALHGAYWHDRFGVKKSHGCVNLSPKDAHAVFEWLEPKLPAGWTSVRYYDLNQAPVVHVYNSSKPKPFAQERNIGPPDKNDEAERLTQAIARREAKEREDAAAALASQSVASLQPQAASLPPSAASLGASPAFVGPTAPQPPQPPRPPQAPVVAPVTGPTSSR